MNRSLDVFAYGTLVIPEVMEAVTGASFPSTPAVLEGYACTLFEGECYPGIASASGERTEGVLYLGIDAATMAVLDRFEGELYDRKRVAVRSEPLGLVSAETYVIARSAGDRISTTPWDEAVFRAEHLEAFLERCREFRKEAG